MKIRRSWVGICLAKSKCTVFSVTIYMTIYMLSRKPFWSVHKTGYWYDNEAKNSSVPL